MIRFACPTCAATFTVDDAKSGAAGKCPKCQARFVIPVAGPAAPPPTAPPADYARPSRRPLDDASTRPSRRRDDEDEDRPSRRRARDEYHDGGSRPSRGRRDEDSDDYDDRPRRRSRYRDDDRPQESKRIAAALFALFLGGWGIHKFFLGDTAAGIIMLAVWWLSFLTGFFCLLPFLGCVVVNLIALVEAIVYLCMSDRDFIRKYQR